MPAPEPRRGANTTAATPMDYVSYTLEYFADSSNARWAVRPPMSTEVTREPCPCGDTSCFLYSPTSSGEYVKSEDWYIPEKAST